MTARQAQIVTLLKTKPAAVVARHLGITTATVYATVRDARRRCTVAKAPAYYGPVDPVETLEEGSARRDREVADGKRCGRPCWLAGPHAVCTREGRS